MTFRNLVRLAFCALSSAIGSCTKTDNIPSTTNTWTVGSTTYKTVATARKTALGCTDVTAVSATQDTLHLYFNYFLPTRDTIVPVTGGGAGLYVFLTDSKSMQKTYGTSPDDAAQAIIKVKNNKLAVDIPETWIHRELEPPFDSLKFSCHAVTEQ